MRKFMVILALSLSLLGAETLRIGAGAGYKNFVEELISNFENGSKTQGVYANISSVVAQARNSDIKVIIGDESFLNTQNLSKIRVVNLGRGKLVVAYAKGLNLGDLKALESSEIKRVSIPDFKKAIYGIAGSEAIKNSGISVSKKLIVTSTVPQASSYIVTGEVEAGFINLTAALNLKGKIGGYLLVDEALYNPIKISAYELKGCDELCLEFTEFLASDRAKEIAKKHGL